jgi:hypothetical protein
MYPFERRSTRRNARAEQGQSLLEMCFGFVVLIMILSGVIDIGRAYFTYVALEDSAGEAVLFLSAFPECPESTSGPNCDDPNNARWRAIHAGGEGGDLVDWAGATFDFDCTKNDGVTDVACDDIQTGDIANVTITYNFPLLSPIIPEINGSPTLVLTSEASQLVTAPTD